ncbi:hypothetical protein V9T40_014932 [Parthenolecanium corni]|uniref:Uncharacterized protein n=1 Tax=Parthenolecanium corni TaxID=536013 RepID=A0AAN9TJM1_9HEMI
MNDDEILFASGDEQVVRGWHLQSDGVLSSDENEFVTGGTDSRLVFWRNMTEESRLEEIKTTQERVEQGQHLSNLLQSEQLL